MGKGILGNPPVFLGDEEAWMRVPGHENVGKPKPKKKDTRNWQQKSRDYLNDVGRKYLGPHGDRAFGLLGMAAEFSDAADIRDAMDYSKKTVDAVRRGDWWGAAGAAPWMLAASGAAMMPGVSMGMADEAAEGVQKGIRAYHGSPHDFDRFDMSKIGTGEGAQAYGHGLYFAETEDVAKGYRDRIAGAEWVDKRGIAMNSNTIANDVMDEARKDGMGVIDAQELAGLWSTVARNPEGTVNLPGHTTIKKVLDRHGIRLREKGSMYEVSINADPDAFLDWDKPLSEQPQNVRDALARIDPDMWHPSGGDYDPTEAGQSIYHRAISVTDANRDKLKSKYGEEALFKNPAELTNRELGIPGIKYLDAGSRGAGDGTRNYVVFDDKLVSIVKKYGIAGASAILGYNVLQGMDPAQAAELQSYAPQQKGSGW
jgi:hypothetical protein